MCNAEINIQQLEKAIEKWECTEVVQNNPVYGGLRSVAHSLVQMAPILGTVLTDTVERGLEMHQNKVRQDLLDTILKCKDLIDPEQIDGVAFITEYAKTQEVLVRLANDKKVRFICNLFGNYFLLEQHRDDVDLYEEYLHHLSSLSYREIELLMGLEYFERAVSHEHSTNGLERRKSAYAKLKLEAKKRWGISATQLDGMMTSISKSGFCKEVTGTYIGYTGGMYHTTEYFRTFLKYIEKLNIKSTE